MFFLVLLFRLAIAHVEEQGEELLRAGLVESALELLATDRLRVAGKVEAALFAFGFEQVRIEFAVGSIRRVDERVFEGLSQVTGELGEVATELAVVAVGCLAKTGQSSGSRLASYTVSPLDEAITNVDQASGPVPVVGSLGEEDEIGEGFLF